VACSFFFEKTQRNLCVSFHWKDRIWYKHPKRYTQHYNLGRTSVHPKSLVRSLWLTNASVALVSHEKYFSRCTCYLLVMNKLSPHHTQTSYTNSHTSMVIQYNGLTHDWEPIKSWKIGNFSFHLMLCWQLVLSTMYKIPMVWFY
jgi:hypothetical protein